MRGGMNVRKMAITTLWLLVLACAACLAVHLAQEHVPDMVSRMAYRFGGGYLGGWDRAYPIAVKAALAISLAGLTAEAIVCGKRGIRLLLGYRPLVWALLPLTLGGLVQTGDYFTGNYFYWGSLQFFAGLSSGFTLMRLGKVRKAIRSAALADRAIVDIALWAANGIFLVQLVAFIAYVFTR